MSVAVFYDDELCGLWFKLGGGDDVQYALAVASAANHAAYELSYRESVNEVPALAKPVEREEGWCPGPKTWVDNLLYNCVSNGGTNFMPEAEAKLLRLVAMSASERISLAARGKGKGQ